MAHGWGASGQGSSGANAASTAVGCLAEQRGLVHVRPSWLTRGGARRRCGGGRDRPPCSHLSTTRRPGRARLLRKRNRTGSAEMEAIAQCAMARPDSPLSGTASSEGTELVQREVPGEVGNLLARIERNVLLFTVDDPNAAASEDVEVAAERWVASQGVLCPRDGGDGNVASHRFDQDSDRQRVGDAGGPLVDGVEGRGCGDHGLGGWEAIFGCGAEFRSNRVAAEMTELRGVEEHERIRRRDDEGIPTRRAKAWDDEPGVSRWRRPGDDQVDDAAWRAHDNHDGGRAWWSTCARSREGEIAVKTAASARALGAGKLL